MPTEAALAALAAAFVLGWLLGSRHAMKRHLERLDARFAELRHFLTGEIE